MRLVLNLFFRLQPRINRGLIPITWRPYSTIDKSVESENTAEKKKKEQLQKITLISEADKVSITSLQDAQKLADRRSLKIVKIIDLDTKTQRPIYK